MALMAFFFFFFFLATFFANPFSLLAHKPHISSRISVVGVVYCNTCSTKTFSKHSYFLPGVDVHIQCKFKAIAPRTAEQIDFTVNRTTDKHGTYKVELANLDGVDCVDDIGSSIESSCQATLIKTTNSSCKIPLLRSTTDQITIKSKKENHCIYNLNALSYKPKSRNTTLCGQKQEQGQELEKNNSLYPPLLGPPPRIFRPPSPQGFNLGDPRS